MDYSPAFYQKVRWLELKAAILDEPAYCRDIHEELARQHFINVLDCGTGTGKFAQKLQAVITFDHLVGIDIDAGLINEAVRTFESDSRMTFLERNFYELPDDVVQRESFDLITGQAFLEHTKLDDTLEVLRRLCKPNAWLYFAHNYTSPVLFEPASALDDRIVGNFDRYAIESQVYSGRACGDSRCGQKLYHTFWAAGFKVVQFSVTPWLLSPKDGAYAEPEKELLRMIVQFFYEANKNPAIPLSLRVQEELLEPWKRQRESEIEDGRLVFICPQTSILLRHVGALRP